MPNQFALRCVSRNDDRLPILDAKRAFAGIEMEPGLAGLLVGAVALEAIVGKDGADFAGEIDGGGGLGRETSNEEQYCDCANIPPLERDTGPVVFVGPVI